MKSLKLVYKPSTSVTGKQLKLALASSGLFSRVLKVISQNKRIKANFFLRWGDNRDYNVPNSVELNTKEAVSNAIDKRRSLMLLSAAGVLTPEFTTDFSQGQIDAMRDSEGGFYIRGAGGEVRYDTTVIAGDRYVSKPVVNKKREYRVHVFNGKILAIYEKIPNTSEDDTPTRLYKSYNCHFSLCNPDTCRIGQAGQDVAIKAVEALGLLFGGVDLIYTYDKEKPEGERKGCVVTEVNSAPGLNNTNIGRWVEAIKEYVNDYNTIQE